MTTLSSRPGFSVQARKANGQLAIDPRFPEFLSRLPDGNYVVAVEKEAFGRSAAQNRAYWGLIVAPCSESSGYEPDEVHELLKRFCNPKTISMVNKATGEVEDVTIGGSTTALTVEEFSAYYRRCQQFAAERWDCDCPSPNEERSFIAES